MPGDPVIRLGAARRSTFPTRGEGRFAGHRRPRIHLHRHARHLRRLAIVKEPAPAARIAARSRWALVARIAFGDPAGEDGRPFGRSSRVVIRCDLAAARPAIFAVTARSASCTRLQEVFRDKRHSRRFRLGLQRRRLITTASPGALKRSSSAQGPVVPPGEPLDSAAPDAKSTLDSRRRRRSLPTQSPSRPVFPRKELGTMVGEVGRVGINEGVGNGE